MKIADLIHEPLSPVTRDKVQKLVIAGLDRASRCAPPLIQEAIRIEVQGFISKRYTQYKVAEPATDRTWMFIKSIFQDLREFSNCLDEATAKKIRAAVSTPNAI